MKHLRHRQSSRKAVFDRFPTQPAARSRRDGLTLLELLLVLVILTVVATIAVESIEPKIDQSRFDTTQQTIQNVDDAILAETTNTDGTQFYSGLFVDLGGLPRGFAELDDDGRDILTLRELWQNPAGYAAFSLRPATNTPTPQLANSKDLDGDAINPDSEVVLGTGWRGPYLRLSIGSDGLTDAWGNKLASYPNGTEYSHLRGAADIDVISAGQAIYGVRSLGRDDLLGGIDYDRDLPSIASGLTISNANLFGEVKGQVLVDNSMSNGNANHVIVQLYYPDRDTGLIRVERATVAYRKTNNGNRDEFDYEFEMKAGAGSNIPVNFPVGPRAIRCYFDKNSDAGDFSDGSSDPTKKSRVKYFRLLPNMNSIDFDLT